jgi:hypothetical protein
MKVCVIVLFVCVGLTLALVGDSAAQSVAAAGALPPSSDSLVRRIDGDTYRIGNLTLNKRTRQINIPGKASLTDGLVEYLAVSMSGKSYESVLVLDIQPLHLQLALLLLGASAGGNLQYQGDTAAPTGDTVDILVKWVDPKGDTIAKPATDLVFDAGRKTVMQKTGWVFTGSMIREGSLMADLDGSIIATYSDPVALLNNPLEGRAQNGYQGQPVYLANKEVVPPMGTDVIMEIRIR